MKHRSVRELRDLVIDEVSLVDKGANQHATVTIAKNHGEEEQDMDLYDEHGELVDPASLEDGQVVFDAEGSAYVYELDAEDDVETVDEVDEGAEIEARELAGVSKAFRKPESKVSKSLTDQVREELSKALSDDDRDAVISKALGRVEELERIAKRAEQAAEQERVLRLEREYTEIAKNYNVPVEPSVLGGVLMRAAEALSYEDCEVIAKCLEAAGEALFEENGYRGGGDNVDVFGQVQALVDQQVSKSGLSREEAVTSVFETNPQAYDEYLATRRGL